MKEKDMLLKIYKLEQIILALLILLVVIVTVGASKLYEKNSTKSESSDSEYNTKYDVSMFKEIKASDIEKETKNKLSVIFVGRSTCGWCAAFLPTLWQAQEEYRYTTLYIDIAKIIDFENNGVLDQDSYDIMINLKGDKYDDYMKENFGSTPMILIMKDNKIVKAQTGYSEYDTFEELLESAGITK